MWGLHSHRIFMSQTAFRSFTTPLRFRLYPSGEFSATKIKETSSLLPPEPAPTYEAATRMEQGDYRRGKVSDELFDSLIRSTLGSSNVPNSHKEVKPRGRKGMTKYNKRLLINSVLLLERKYGKKHLSFLTLTLPPECASSDPHLYAESKRQMSQWLQRTLVRCALPAAVIGCTEVQSDRLANKGQFALHEHWVFVGRRQWAAWAISPQELKEAWGRILGTVYKLANSSDLFVSSVRVESIRKSAAAYLGKYISKGEKCVEQLIAGGYEQFLPSSWVTKTALMLSMFRASIITIVGKEAREIMEALQDNASVFCRWSRNLRLELASGIECWLGFVGYLSVGGIAYLRTMAVSPSVRTVLHCR